MFLSCQTAFTALEDQKLAFLATLESLPPAHLAHTPALGVWSALQVLDHLVRVEVGTSVATRRGLRSPHHVSEQDRMAAQRLDDGLRSEARYTVPAGAESAHPAPNPEWNDLVDRWSKNRIKLAGFLETLTDDQIHLGCFDHPGSGWMTASMVLDFLHAHTLHHTYQLKRLRESLA